MKTYNNLFERIISAESLFSAWDAFRRGKQKKPDVQRFEWNLERNIFKLRRDLKNKTYRHGPYADFYICDPKKRHIHKATVRDRVLHHAIFSVINPVFEETFIPASFSCRLNLGTHKGVETLERMARATTKNGKGPCFVLKCDIQKFFDSVDHKILLSILERRIKDREMMWLLESVVESFAAENGRRDDQKGIPIGNLTSQLFANVYLNDFDQFVKHSLHIRHYVRYTDDFAIVSADRAYLEGLIKPMKTYLADNLLLEIHPNKIFIQKLHRGVDFLGYVIFPKHRLIRTKTKRRIFRKFKKRLTDYLAGNISTSTLNATLQSYLGILSHANADRLAKEMKNFIGLIKNPPTVF